MSEVQIKKRNGEPYIRVVVEEYGEESVEAMGIEEVTDILKEMHHQRLKTEEVFIHKGCGGELSFDSFGKFKCGKCRIVSKDKDLIEVV